MDGNGVHTMRRLGGSQGEIRAALDALSQKQGSVDQVRRTVETATFDIFLMSSPLFARGVVRHSSASSSIAPLLTMAWDLVYFFSYASLCGVEDVGTLRIVEL